MAKLSEREIIVVMREAIEVLKEKYMHTEGAWAVVDFISAANNANHWMRAVTRAERLSEPYWKERKSKGKG